MDTLSQHINTQGSVYEKALRKLQKQSERIMVEKVFDIPYDFKSTDYYHLREVINILCNELECDFSLNDCIIEKINLYLEKRN